MTNRLIDAFKAAYLWLLRSTPEMRDTVLAKVTATIEEER